MMKDVLRDKVFAFTDEKGLFSTPCHVLLGLSGGADSMALLHVLTRWPMPELRVSAIHIHHGLRGEKADADEAFVRDYCARSGVPLTVVHADVVALAKKEHLSVEEAGRRIRYEQFESTRCAVGADYVLTAHTADDQVETVLMHLIRGCGIDGLAGIPAVRGTIRRPLLGATRGEVEAYCAVNSIPFVVDETNTDTKYTRNAVRHRVLPVLREINPSVGEALLRVSRHADAEVAYLNTCVSEALQHLRCENGYDAKEMRLYPAPLRRRMVRQLLREAQIPTIEETHILAADEAIVCDNRTVSLSDEYLFSVEQGVVSVRKATTDALSLEVTPESIPCEVRFGGYSCILTCDENIHKLFLQSAVDYDKIVGKLSIRCRRSGDYLHPCGRGVGKSLKKLMNEWRIPAHERESYPILCDEVGVILVPGYTCDERVRVTETTKHYLVCEMSKVQA